MDASSEKPESRKRALAIVRYLALVTAVVVGLSWVSNSYNVWHEREINRSVAAEMLAVPASARIAVNDHVTRTGSLVGSGKGIAIPPSKMGPSHSRNVEWTVSEDGHISGRTAGREQIAVDWTPSITGTHVAWTCTVTFPENRTPRSPPPCPEIR